MGYSFSDYPYVTLQTRRSCVTVILCALFTRRDASSPQKARLPVDKFPIIGLTSEDGRRILRSKLRAVDACGEAFARGEQGGLSLETIGSGPDGDWPRVGGQHPL